MRPMMRMDPEERDLDAEAVADVKRMFYGMPGIQLSRDAFLSMVLCGPFSFGIPRLGLVSNDEMRLITEHHWMPWQRTVYDWIKMIGICPYYVEARGEHWIPVVPEMDLGIISVTVTKTHKLRYKWRWNHGMDLDEDKNMYWVLSDYTPDRYGKLRSPLASLLAHYRTILVIQQSTEVASAQCARPTHVMEYHPSASSVRNDHLTGMSATFSEKVAGLSQARQEAAKANEIRIRTAELMRQLRDSSGAPGQNQKKRLLWTDLEEDAVDRGDNGLASRVYPLRPDYKYVAPQKASIVTDLDKHLHYFNVMAAARMDFSPEFFQPTGARGGANFAGAERYQNERIKEALGFFTRITKTALILCYRKQFEQGFAQAKEWKRRHPRRAPDGSHVADDVAEMYPELDVEVYLECTPFMGYEELRGMWLDGVMSKETFAHHAFHLRALPMDEIELGAQVVDIHGKGPPKETTSKPPKKAKKAKV